MSLPPYWILSPSWNHSSVTTHIGPQGLGSGNISIASEERATTLRHQRVRELDVDIEYNRLYLHRVPDGDAAPQRNEIKHMDVRSLPRKATFAVL